MIGRGYLRCLIQPFGLFKGSTKNVTSRDNKQEATTHPKSKLTDFFPGLLVFPRRFPPFFLPHQPPTLPHLNNCHKITRPTSASPRGRAFKVSSTPLPLPLSPPSHSKLACDVAGCFFQVKHASALRQHRAHCHGVDVVWHHCQQEGCLYKAKQVGNLKQHLSNIHDVGVKWYECQQEGCNYKAKQAGNLKQHLSDIHDIGVRWHVCGEEGCTYKAKQAGALKRHSLKTHAVVSI